MTKVTYLFGAGASHPTLPVVGGMIQALEDFQINVRQNFLKGDTIRNNRRRLILEDLEELIKLIRPAYSVDTLAKTLTRNDPKQLKKLKDLLSIYFLYLQAANDVNNRYDLFFSTILADPLRVQLPSTMNIISWNYDYQFELAYNKQSLLKNLTDIQKDLNVFDKFCDPSTDDRFQIFKMNGSAGFNDSDGKPIDFLFGDKPFSDLGTVLETYEQVASDDKIKSAISFAWEPGSAKFQTCLTNAIRNSDVLVIIGYSFPDFNREHDILYMSQFYDVTKVFIQDPNYEHVKSKVVDIFMDDRYLNNLKLRMGKIFPVNNPGNSGFYIPQNWFPYPY